MNRQRQEIATTREMLAAAAGRPMSAVVGFDGFVDEIIEVVDKRFASGADGYSRIPTIAALGERIGKAAGFSANIELVSRTVKLGGNGPIMANALQALGMEITYIGALGKPTIHPVFNDLATRARVISIAEPAHTDALEFSDGKIMLGKLQSLDDVNWDNLLAAMPLPQLQAVFSEIQLLAATNWTMLPFATALWQNLWQQALPAAKNDKLVAFFDLADPEKRPVEDLQAALRTIEQFNTKCRAVLGLNRKEANQVATALGIRFSGDISAVPLSDITRAIAEKLSVYGVVVHPTKQAACVVNGEFALADGPYTPTPTITTGAGDNFNAGFCRGLICGLPPTEALICGVGASGYYVRHAHSASLPQLLAFLDAWYADGANM